MHQDSGRHRRVAFIGMHDDSYLVGPSKLVGRVLDRLLGDTLPRDHGRLQPSKSHGVVPAALREGREPRPSCRRFQAHFGIDLGHRSLSTLGTSATLQHWAQQPVIAPDGDPLPDDADLKPAKKRLAALMRGAVGLRSLVRGQHHPHATHVAYGLFHASATSRLDYGVKLFSPRRTAALRRRFDIIIKKTFEFIVWGRVHPDPMGHDYSTARLWRVRVPHMDR